MIGKGEQDTIKRIKEWIPTELGPDWRCVSISRYEGTLYKNGGWLAVAMNGAQVQDAFFTYDAHGALCWIQPIYCQDVSDG